MLLYTDGLAEAKNSDGDMYSYKRLRQLFSKIGHATVEEIKVKILDSLEGYRCLDDVTFMVIKRDGHCP